MEIVNAIGIWCHQGGVIVDELVERRLRAKPSYSCMTIMIRTVLRTFCYIEYDAGDGEVEHSMMFYESGKTYGALQDAERDGYTLTDWVTDSGTSINAYTVARRKYIRLSRRGRREL